jgi:hypothetical protein
VGHGWKWNAIGTVPLSPSFSHGAPGRRSSSTPRAFPIPHWVVDAAVQALGIEAQRVGDAQHHFSAQERRSAALVDLMDEVDNYSHRP